MATAATQSDLEAAGHPQIVAAFDMRDPVQVAALGKVLERTPLEVAQDRFSAACKRVNWFVSASLTLAQAVAFSLNRTVPADLSYAIAEKLAGLLAAERDARAALAEVERSAAIEWVGVALTFGGKAHAQRVAA